MFLNEQATVEHFRKHQAAFQELGVDWLASGTDSFCTGGIEWMLWRTHSIYKVGNTWTMRVLAKDSWTDRSFKSLEEAAATIGMTAKELSKWQRQMLELNIECITTVTITYQGKAGRYVQCALPPTMWGYGVRFAPASDVVTSQALARRTSVPPPHARLTMHAIDSGWFYYEGSAQSAVPLSEITGKVLYANGEPAKKVNVGLVAAFGSGGFTDTDQVGRFRATWLPSGRYRVTAGVIDPSIRAYRIWFYPGVLDPDASSEVLVGEDESIDVGTLKVPMAPPPK
jgi:hypothetical protein